MTFEGVSKEPNRNRLFLVEYRDETKKVSFKDLPSSFSLSGLSLDDLKKTGKANHIQGLLYKCAVASLEFNITSWENNGLVLDQLPWRCIYLTEADEIVFDMPTHQLTRPDWESTSFQLALVSHMLSRSEFGGGGRPDNAKFHRYFHVVGKYCKSDDLIAEILNYAESRFNKTIYMRLHRNLAIVGKTMNIKNELARKLFGKHYDAIL